MPSVQAFHIPCIKIYCIQPYDDVSAMVFIGFCSTVEYVWSFRSTKRFPDAVCSVKRYSHRGRVRPDPAPIS